MPDEEVLDPPKKRKKVKFDSDGLPIPQFSKSIQFDEEGLPIPQKKNGTSNGLTNGEDVATTSVPSTSPLHSDGNISEGTSIIDSGEEWTMKKGKWVVTKAGDWSKKGDIADEKYAKIYSENYLNNVYGNNPVPSTSPLPVNDPFSFDKFIPQKLDNEQVVVSGKANGKVVVAPKMAAISLKDADDQDKNILGNLWNSFTDNIDKLGASGADLMSQLLVKVTPSEDGLTDDERLKILRETVVTPGQFETTELIGAKVTPEEKAAFDANIVTSTAGSLVGMLPGIGGKGLGLMLLAQQDMLESVNQTQKGKDLPENTKTIFSWLTGVPVALVDRIPVLKIFGKETNAVAKGVAVKALTNLVKTSKVPITSGMAQAAISAELKSLKNAVIKGGKKLASGSAIEGVTETIQEGVTMLSEAILNKTEGEKIFEETSFKEDMSRLVRAAQGGIVGGGMMSSVAIPFSKSRDYIAERVSEATNPAQIEVLKAELRAAAETKSLTEPEIQEFEKTIDNYVRVNQKIPPDTESRKDIVEKIIEREDLENEVTKKLEEVVSVDEAFKPAIREESEALRGRVEEINEEIKNLASPTDTKLSEPIEGLDEQGIPIGENVPKPTDVDTKNKKIFTDFDDTVWDNKTQKLTPLGEELKAKIAAGEDVEVLTKRENTQENIDFISDKLGIDKSKIKAGLQAEDKGAIVDSESGDKVYYNENQSELDAAKTGDKVNVRSEEDIFNIIKAPVPTGKLKRAEVQVKSIDPETNEVTLTTMQAKKAVVDLKKQVGIIDMIKKCL